MLDHAPVATAEVVRAENVPGQKLTAPRKTLKKGNQLGKIVFDTTSPGSRILHADADGWVDFAEESDARDPVIDLYEMQRQGMYSAMQAAPVSELRQRRLDASDENDHETRQDGAYINGLN